MIQPSDRWLLDVGGTFIKCGNGRCIPIPSGGSRDEIAAALQAALAGFVPAWCGPGLDCGKQKASPLPGECYPQTPAWCGPGQDCGKQKASPLPGNAFRSPVPDPQSPAAIAVAIPGPFDYARGIFLMRHKFAAVYGESFRALAGLPDSVDLRFMHDVVAALQGSLSLQDTAGDCGGASEFGQHSPEGVKVSAAQTPMLPRTKTAAQAAQTAQTAPETALVTIGTGLGFAHTQDGAVQVGPAGSPARSIYNQPWGDGILEDVVSARGIRNAYARLRGRTDLSAAQIAQIAQTGDEAALEVFSTLGETLGEALAPLLEELRVGTLLLAGQVSRSLPLFERPLRNALDGIDIRPAPAGAVFAGLNRLLDGPAPLDATDQ